MRAGSRTFVGGAAPLAIMNRLPPIPNPARYAGLFVFDFGTHVSVGYTAREIRYLRESPAHRTGTAYEIYRVAEDGSIELRGATDERLAARDAICFLRHSAAEARADYNELASAAAVNPLSSPVELRLARVYDLDPPDVTALVFEMSASETVSRWLTQAGVTAGDLVVAGCDAYQAVVFSNNIQFASCELPVQPEFVDRRPEDVVLTIHQPLQR